MSKPEMEGEIRIRVRMYEGADGVNTKIDVGSTKDTPEIIWMMSTEYLVKVAASKSSLGPEKFMELLRESVMGDDDGGKPDISFNPSDN